MTVGAKLMRLGRKDRWLILSAGILAGMAWEPLGLWLGIFPALALFLGIQMSGDRRRVFLNTILFLVPAWGIPFHWVGAHPVGQAALSSVAALIAYASVLGACLAVASTLFAENTIPRLLALMAGLLAFDAFIAFGPLAMPWLSFGLSTAPSSWSLGWAAWAGFRGLTLITLTVASSLYLGIWAWLGLAREKSFRQVAVSTVGGLLIFTAPWFPFLQSTSTHDLPEAQTLTFALVEPGWTPSAWAQVRDTSKVESFSNWLHTTSSHDRAQDVDMFILPETALPLGDHASVRRWIEDLSRSAGTSVISGGILRDMVNGQTLNIGISSAHVEGIHAKRRLVPFAEKVPFSEWIPFFDRFSVASGGVSSYNAGTSAGPVSVAGYSTGIMICFESLFAQDARGLRRAGADMITVLTQDGWWESDAARRQHHAFSRVLAASIATPVLHATVDGRSGGFSSEGQPLDLFSIPSAPVFIGEVALENRSSLYLLSGDWPFFAIFAALLALLMTLYLRSPRRVTS